MIIWTTLSSTITTTEEEDDSPLILGQFISIIGSDATVTVSIHNNIYDIEDIEVLLNMEDIMIKVVISTTFLLLYSSREWTSEYEAIGLSSGDNASNRVLQGYLHFLIIVLQLQNSNSSSPEQA